MAKKAVEASISGTAYKVLERKHREDNLRVPEGTALQDWDIQTAEFLREVLRQGPAFDENNHGGALPRNDQTETSRREPNISPVTANVFGKSIELFAKGLRCVEVTVARGLVARNQPRAVISRNKAMVSGGISNPSSVASNA